ncbi:hypothetical protein [Bacillus piscicola]|uniref:hypothetical protein n=1 Tax=Bacillus piscicola TaxID=1632684 RepID=UPI003B82C806
MIVYVNNRLVIEKDLIPTWEVSFLRSLLNNNAEIHINEVFIASFIGIIIGLVFVVVINKKYVYTISNLFQISNKHGEDDVWDFLLSSNDIEWVTIRDYDTMLVYQGAVIAFSQKDNKRELVLGDVNVYKEEGQELRFLHDMKFNYINFNIESKIIIEIYESEDEASGE